jgi:hypothetical protein
MRKFKNKLNDLFKYSYWTLEFFIPYIVYYVIVYKHNFLDRVDNSYGIFAYIASICVMVFIFFFYIDTIKQQGNKIALIVMKFIGYSMTYVYWGTLIGGALMAIIRFASGEAPSYFVIPGIIVFIGLCDYYNKKSGQCLRKT